MKYEEYTNIVDAWQREQDGDVVYDGANREFVDSMCPCCKRPMNAGSRTKVVIFKPGTGIVDEAWVCEDCLFYLSYGHLDMFEGEVNIKDDYED